MIQSIKINIIIIDISKNYLFMNIYYQIIKINNKYIN